jgi:recombination DNA repair RAD52 pathway protein
MMTTTPREYEPLTVEQLEALHANLNPGRVASRQQGKSGRQLSYMEAYDIKATLIRVFGYAGFSADVTDSQIVQIVPGEGSYVTVLAKATVRVTIHQTGATYTETAAASQAGSQGVGEVADFALKTAASDALKRCAIYLGTQFGLSLYAKTHADVVGVLLPQWQAEALVTEPHPETQSALDRATTVVADPAVAPAEDTVDLPGEGAYDAEDARSEVSS